MSKCLCCQDLNYEANLNNKEYICVLDTRLKHQGFYICNKCKNILDSQKEISEPLKCFLALVKVGLIHHKKLLLKDLNKIEYLILNYGLKCFLYDSDYKHIKKEIAYYEFHIKKAIKKINNIQNMDLIFNELLLIGLKNNASEYFLFTRKQIQEILGIKLYQIKKYDKANNIKGAYTYNKDEINGILEINTKKH